MKTHEFEAANIIDLEMNGRGVGLGLTYLLKKYKHILENFIDFANAGPYSYRQNHMMCSAEAIVRSEINKSLESIVISLQRLSSEFENNPQVSLGALFIGKFLEDIGEDNNSNLFSLEIVSNVLKEEEKLERDKKEKMEDE